MGLQMAHGVFVGSGQLRAGRRHRGSGFAQCGELGAAEQQALGESGHQFAAVIDDGGDRGFTQAVGEAGVKAQCLTAAFDTEGARRVAIMLMGEQPGDGIGGAMLPMLDEFGDVALEEEMRYAGVADGAAAASRHWSDARHGRGFRDARCRRRGA